MTQLFMVYLHHHNKSKNMLFVSTTFVNDFVPLSYALDQCKDYGINSVEIGSNHCYEINYDYITNYDFNYLVHNYFPIPKKSFVLNIASSDYEIRNLSIAHIKKSYKSLQTNKFKSLYFSSRISYRS